MEFSAKRSEKEIMDNEIKTMKEWMDVVLAKHREIMGMATMPVAVVTVAEEIQQLIKALEAGNYVCAPEQLCPNTASGEDLDRMASEAGLMRSCSHEWTEYVGATNAFTYCKKCDIKKP